MYRRREEGITLPYKNLSFYARYPFLADLNRYIEVLYGITDFTLLLQKKPDIVKAAKEKIVAAIKSARTVKFAEEPIEVASFHLALMMLQLLRDKWLINRYALAEAESVQEILSSEKPETIEIIGRKTGIKTLKYHSSDALRDAIGTRDRTVIYRVYEYSLSFPEYVKVAQRLIGDPVWRTVNLPVIRGRVFLDRRRIVRLLKESVENYIRNLINQSSSEPNTIESLELVKQVLDEIAQVLEKNRLRRLRYRGGVKIEDGVLVEEAFPPCMARILDRARAGEHLSHHERFAIATFMLSLGADIEQVVDVFRNMPDFNEKITRYQVEHLAGKRGSGKKYRPYNCETMKTLGLCVSDCGTRSPIQAYYRFLRKYLEGKQSKPSRQTVELR